MKKSQKNNKYMNELMNNMLEMQNYQEAVNSDYQKLEIGNERINEGVMKELTEI